ncbi:MAG: hypothetical protein RR933_05085, partial [Oscillospiraceae bacterium]
IIALRSTCVNQYFAHDYYAALIAREHTKKQRRAKTKSVSAENNRCLVVSLQNEVALGAENSLKAI